MNKVKHHHGQRGSRVEKQLGKKTQHNKKSERDISQPGRQKAEGAAAKSEVEERQCCLVWRCLEEQRDSSPADDKQAD